MPSSAQLRTISDPSGGGSYVAPCLKKWPSRLSGFHPRAGRSPLVYIPIVLRAGGFYVVELKSVFVRKVTGAGVKRASHAALPADLQRWKTLANPDTVYFWPNGTPCGGLLGALVIGAARCCTPYWSIQTACIWTLAEAYFTVTLQSAALQSKQHPPWPSFLRA